MDTKLNPMENYDYIIPLFAIAGFVLFSFSQEAKDFRRKHVRVLRIIQIVAIAYFLVNGIQTGDKFDFALAAIFIVDIVIKYWRDRHLK